MAEFTLDRDLIRKLFDLSGAVYATRGGAYRADPYPTFAQRRATGPVHVETPHEPLGWTEPVVFQGLPYPDRPHFTAYDYESCSTVLRDDRFVSMVTPMRGEPVMPDLMLYMDGKRHRRYRALVQPSFVPARATWWLEQWISTTVHSLIDGLEKSDRADLNVEFCAPIPLLTITGSFGISVDEALEIRAAVTADGIGLDTIFGLLGPIIEARRLEPRDDLISVLVGAEVADDGGEVHRLTDDEILGFAFLLLAAGSGTTWKQMGTTLVALLRNADALAAAREDRAFLRDVVEESLRWTPTDPVFARFVVHDTTLGGVELPAGAIVHACLGAANRDPQRWDHPDDFDPFRPMKQHLGFGQGAHTCLGMHVARAEIVCGIGALLDRLPNLRLDPDAPEPQTIGIYERGPTAVPVRFGGSA